MNRARRGYAGDAPAASPVRWSVPLDVVREDDGLKVHASLPGVDAENIEVSVEDDVLTIAAATHAEAEHEQGEYLAAGATLRLVSAGRCGLPDAVDAEAIKPVYRNGTLTITIPRAESRKARKLTVVVGVARRDCACGGRRCSDLPQAHGLQKGRLPRGVPFCARGAIAIDNRAAAALKLRLLSPSRYMRLDGRV